MWNIAMVFHLPLVGRSERQGSTEVDPGGGSDLGNLLIWLYFDSTTPTRTLPVAAFDLPARGRWKTAQTSKGDYPSPHSGSQ